MRKSPSGHREGRVLSSQHGTVEARNLWEWCWVPGGASPGLGCRRCWGRSRGISEIAHFVRSLVGSKHGAVERGGREAVQCPRTVEMPLQILSPNREAGDLLGKSTNLLWLLAGLSHHHPTLPEPACQGGRKRGGHAHLAPKPPTSAAASAKWVLSMVPGSFGWTGWLQP